MPTARPSITARIGVVELMAATRVTSSRIAMAMPTPTTAVIRGRPAATSDPNTTVSTTRATMSPTASMIDNAGSWMLKA